MTNPQLRTTLHRSVYSIECGLISNMLNRFKSPSVSTARYCALCNPNLFLNFSPKFCSLSNILEKKNYKMKTRFNTADIVAMVAELQKYIGMRVGQIYDVDSKTYLFKLNRYEEKVTLLLESGFRIHTTGYEWPKNPAPSGFSMKLRKHVKNKRLEKLSQLGFDRILDLQFGINDAAYHVILELYDRGNLILTDHEYTILNVLRPRNPADQDVKFVVRERYPIEMAKQYSANEELLQKVLETIAQAGKKDTLKKILMTLTPYGSAIIDHILHNTKPSKESNFLSNCDSEQLKSLLEEAHKIFNDICNNVCKGYIIQKAEKRQDNTESVFTSVEFHPYLFEQHKNQPFTAYDTFDKAVDVFYSELEGQKIDSRMFKKEKEALDKLKRVKTDHEQRLIKLSEQQSEDTYKACLIELNLDIVEQAINIIRSAIANQISWTDIWGLVREAQAEGDTVALAIKKLKFEINHFTMLLGDPYHDGNGSCLVDIDLDLTAYANARKYYNLKRQHALKEQKTLESSEKAFKNAEKKTKQMLKEVNVISNITKARKPIWFEKFLWFISSENFLVIAGRDIPQNEVIVKRYMKPGDIYVHADVHGASSIIIKNPTKDLVPPKTLNEAGTFAVCNSTAWNAKVLTSAWWVHHHQVSKTAPTGEYLTAGSFMIRGKKNYLLPSHLILGFGFMFRLDEDSMERHKGDRQVRQADSMSEASTYNPSEDLYEEIDIDDGASTNDEEDHANDDGDPIPDQQSNAENGKDADNKTTETTEDIMENNDEAAQTLKDVEENSDDEDTEDEDGSKSIAEENSTMDEVRKMEEISFPDTEVQLSVFSTDSNKIVRSNSNPGEPTLIIVPKISKNRKKQTSATKAQPEPVQNCNQVGQKRGQKGKLKKIKEKYKHQDDDERELKMKILASAGEPKSSKNKKKANGKKSNAKPIQAAAMNIGGGQSSKEANEVKITKIHTEVKVENEEHSGDDQVDDEDDEVALNEEMNIINSLTGLPLAEDTILYSVPVCAPYSALQNYKYKVKVMPGNGRRGKAAKMALNIFVQDKGAIQREKDCLRSVKDQDISRNFPGKVKVAYANLKKK